MMFGQKGFDQNLLDAMQGVFSHYPIKKVVLFGSRARGDATPYSDIDLAIYPSAPLQHRGKLLAELDELRTLKKIDAVLIGENTNQELLRSIEREGVTIYGPI